jgi:hypothetical protein
MSAQPGTSLTTFDETRQALYLTLLARGNSPSTAARKAQISPGTVRNYRALHPMFATAEIEARLEATDRVADTVFRAAVGEKSDDQRAYEAELDRVQQDEHQQALDRSLIDGGIPPVRPVPVSAKPAPADVKSATWWLERRAPQEFGPPLQRVQAETMHTEIHAEATLEDIVATLEARRAQLDAPGERPAPLVPAEGANEEIFEAEVVSEAPPPAPPADIPGPHLLQG